ncbi:MAG: carbonic anhydrase [Coxiellaceae bacterium]|nr:carbonic anhydrase [Coxiellaceae bacterium]
MQASMEKLLKGYRTFRQQYAEGATSLMQQLSEHGQQPETMVIACSDSRVDPALILQTQPGDLFMVRNVANIVPPYEVDSSFHGTSAALEFGICYLNVKHLIILGHSQCGGIQALLHGANPKQDDFISHWVSVIGEHDHEADVDHCSRHALTHSYNNCMTFPWIKSRVEQKQLAIHRWFFDIKAGEISVYDAEKNQYSPLK